MRRLLAAAALAFLALSSSGCIVTSIYPFYSDDAVAFDPALLGKWLEDNGQTTYTFAKEGEKTYRAQLAERKGGGETEDSTLIVRLFRLGNAQYLDAYPAKAGDLSVGGHFLVRVEWRGDTLTMRPLDVEAFDRIPGTAASLPHVHRLDDGTVAGTAGGPGFAGTLLMAPTRELQALLQQHGAEIFEKEVVTMKRVEGTASR